MARIDRNDSNLYEMPKGSYLRNQRYVYINTSSKYVTASERKTEGTRGYKDHDSKCIGVIKDPSDESCRMFYANKTYKEQFLSDSENEMANEEKKEDPDPPTFADSLSIGLNSWIGVCNFCVCCAEFHAHCVII